MKGRAGLKRQTPSPPPPGHGPNLRGRGGFSACQCRSRSPLHSPGLSMRSEAQEADVGGCGNPLCKMQAWAWFFRLAARPRNAVVAGSECHPKEAEAPHSSTAPIGEDAELGPGPRGLKSQQAPSRSEACATSAHRGGAFFVIGSGDMR
ncbi:unnamed protein product [Symbiodinium sp. CCMP2592]|nr:unnamed protein product [Symbiodinium sp. CCMP2592]